MYTNNEIMFPHHVIPTLRKLRGPKWRALVERILKLPETHEETLAFMMMMIRVNGCMACETDSYRAMRGCMACAQQTPPLAVGAVAPAFSLPGATRYGLLQDPVRLSDFRGKTVVLAFYFRSRTRG